jgi:hypothetical protein
MYSAWLPALAMMVAFGAPEVGPEAAAPAEATEATEAEAAFTEVVRVKRDFGKPHFDLVIDAWSGEEAGRLEATQLRWVNTSEHDRRKPLGRMIERMVHLQYKRLSSARLTVVVAGDGKEFTFTVEQAADGEIHAYVPVDTDDGRFIPRCRAGSARLLARRVVGLPVGIDRIAVTCSEAGASYHGQIRHRPV